MSITTTRPLLALLGAGMIALTAGCASQEDIDKARIEAKEALGAAQRAEEAALRADSTAAGASLDADAAKVTAAEAAACCIENIEKIERAEQKVRQ